MLLLLFPNFAVLHHLMLSFELGTFNRFGNKNSAPVATDAVDADAVAAVVANAVNALAVVVPAIFY